jgi:hypothetical protein
MDRQDNDPYLERYYVFLRDRKHFPFNIFVHKFLKSDPDVVHDHPWPYATLILRGGYWEWVPEFDAEGTMVGETRHWRAPGSFRTAGANTYHRVELEPGVTPWTLFMPGPQQRDWGFLVDNKWIPNVEFFDLRRKKA